MNYCSIDKKHKQFDALFTSPSRFEDDRSYFTPSSLECNLMTRSNTYCEQGRFLFFIRTMRPAVISGLALFISHLEFV